MLRSFTLTMVLGTTIIVQCAGQEPESTNSQEKTEVAKPMEASTPKTTPPVKETQRPSTESVQTPAAGATEALDTAADKLELDCIQKNCNCSDFSQQKEAQAVLEAFPDDPHGLDRNNDGIACESLLK
ncbi:excalibur calcium-binding domain-containing protein [Lyngbya aestuarii]|uniref:excalibur calcium-binding domain-containing protein n=1 Tax=Lyngbya aestuarii TaxID=118322 RepID=UPI00403D6E82